MKQKFKRLLKAVKMLLVRRVKGPSYWELRTEYIALRTTYLDGQRFSYPPEEQEKRWERLKELDQQLSSMELKGHNHE